MPCPRTIPKHPKHVGWVERSETHPPRSNAPFPRTDNTVAEVVPSRARHNQPSDQVVLPIVGTTCGYANLRRSPKTSMGQLLDQRPSAITFEQRPDLTRLAARMPFRIAISDIESDPDTTQILPDRLSGGPREADVASAGAREPIGVEPPDRGSPDGIPLPRIEREEIGQPIRRTGLISLLKPPEDSGYPCTRVHAD